MRLRVAELLIVAVVGSFVAHAAGAASYQKVDGTIVDPILYWRYAALPHHYAGPDLGPGANLVGAWLQDANLRDANLASAVLSGANLSLSNLLGADLRGADLTGTSLQYAEYDESTLFPIGADPEVLRMVRVQVINNGFSPPNPENLIAHPPLDESYLGPLFAAYVQNVGCDNTTEYPCVSPGPATAASGVAQRVEVFESSSFTGELWDYGSLTVRDSATATITGPLIDVGFSAFDNSSLTVTGCGSYVDTACSVFSYGQSTVSAQGFFEYLEAHDQSHLVFSGATYHGDGIIVYDEATAELASGCEMSILNVLGGRAIAHPGSEVYYGTFVDKGGVVEMTGGALEGSTFGNVIDGDLIMNAGSISFALQVNGYASIRGGIIEQNVPAIEAANQGVVEIFGGAVEPAIPLWARGESRIRIFGSAFRVNDQPVGHGSVHVSASGGSLSATLASGDPIANPFAHRGADCGGQPCTGRILVLAPGLDWDQDAIPNVFDNCAEEPNADQADLDSDGTGDVCFSPVDLDRDGIVDALDNCRVDSNPDQADADSDGVGDACEKELIFWADKGLDGCTTPPKRLPYEMVTSDLGNGDVIDRSAQACDCFGIEFPVTPGAASVRFLHRLPSGAVEEYCENVAPYALGLGPNQPICADGLDEDGLHELMVTPFDAPGCEAGDGEALPSSIRRFEMAAPEPGLAVMVGVGVLGLAGVSRGRERSARN